MDKYFLKFFTLFMLFSQGTFASNGADLTFDVGVFTRQEGSIRDIATESDGDLILVGTFERVAGVRRDNIVRFSPEGSLDVNFNPIVNGTIYKTVLQSDGKIIIAGSFSQVNGKTAQGIARLHVDGTLDSDFSSSFPRVSEVKAIVIDSEQRILVGGTFRSVDGVSQANLVRLNSNGEVDFSFMPMLMGPSPVYTQRGYVNAIALQEDGKIVIGGVFTSINYLARNKIARLNSDGTVDEDFDPDTGNTNPFDLDVEAIEIASNGQLYVAGGFTSMNGIATSGLVRLTAAGELDTTFSSQIRTFRHGTMIPLADGGVIIAGGYSWPILGGFYSSMHKLENSGEIDMNFSVSLGWLPLTLHLDQTSKIIVGGYIRSARLDPLNALRRIDLNGIKDQLGIGVIETSFTRDSNAIEKIKAMSDGKVLVGGSFTSLGGARAQNIALLDQVGKVDPLFSASVNDSVKSMDVRPDGKILVAGKFDVVNELGTGSVVRLNSNGSIDLSFARVSQNCAISGVLALPNDKVLIWGCFTQVNLMPQRHIAVLNSDGTLDTSFKKDIDARFLFDVKMQADGKILLVGEFQVVNGSARNYLARLNSDGSLDTEFTPAIDKQLRSILLTAPGDIVVGGDFDYVNGVAKNSLAKLDSNGELVESFTSSVNGHVYVIAEQGDGKLIIGGLFTRVESETINNAARLYSDGSLDVTFQPEPDNVVEDIAILPDGRVLLAGSFSEVTKADFPRYHIARFDKKLPSELTISTSSSQKEEGNIGASIFSYTVTREQDLESQVSVDYSVQGSGTFEANSDDFGGAFPSGTLVLAPEETSKQFNIEVTSDYFVEASEQFDVVLEALGKETLVVGSVASLIVNDDTDDADGDGIAAGGDNCPSISNFEQADLDMDSIGDGCDPDVDGDFVDNEVDNCPRVLNVAQSDIDSDGLGDLCDVDDDNDGVEDAFDLDKSSPFICQDIDADGCDDCSIGVDQFGVAADANPSMDGVDTNSNGQCDFSDPDDDGDSIFDVDDNCPLISNADQLDNNGFEDSEGLGDACEVVLESDICFPVRVKNKSVSIVCL
jgi:uncharacterized delta-60 repeat protein